MCTCQKASEAVPEFSNVDSHDESSKNACQDRLIKAVKFHFPDAKQA